MRASVVAGGDPPPGLNPWEDVLDLVALSVENLVVVMLDLSVLARRDAGVMARSVRAARNQSLS